MGKTPRGFLEMTSNIDILKLNGWKEEYYLIYSIYDYRILESKTVITPPKYLFN